MAEFWHDKNRIATQQIRDISKPLKIDHYAIEMGRIEN